MEEGEAIQHNAGLVDELDLSMGFAQTAVELDYVRPVMTSRYVFTSQSRVNKLTLVQDLLEYC